MSWFRLLRWPLLVAGAVTAFTVLLFGLLYWQTTSYLTANMDGVITSQADQLAAEPESRRAGVIEDRLASDPRRVRLTGLFDQSGHRLMGNLAVLPPDLPIDAPARRATVMRTDERGPERQEVRAIARSLSNGDVLVVGRIADEIDELAALIRRALVIGMVPTLAVAILGAILLDLRTRRRLEQVAGTAQRIVAGDLRQRLPVRPDDDDFNRLARVINGMLGDIERLVHEIAGVGDDIAHELRTPLTRVRATLERGRANAGTVEDLQGVVDRAIGGLDRALAIVTALLRIAEIEHRRRLEGFAAVDPARLVREVAELYLPIAEDRGVTLDVAADDVGSVRGDPDLLFEAVANLVDNAIKFTPAGGRVALALLARDGACVIRVADSGPGIASADRDTVTRRFFRSEKSRTTAGFGLGLTLVAAIAKLHGFQLSIGDPPGCVIDLICPLG